jgi:hypothetical protein
MTHLKYGLLAALLVLAAGSVSCSERSSTAPSSLPWRETGLRFDTTDLSRAQKEIPFPIRLPTYVPNNDRSPERLPQITGTLKVYQQNSRAEVEVFYLVSLGSSATGVIRVQERNYPIVPPDPKTDPRYQYVEIAGRTAVSIVGDFSEGHGTKLYFEEGSLYFELGVYGFSQEEATTVAASLFDQDVGSIRPRAVRLSRKLSLATDARLR